MELEVAATLEGARRLHPGMLVKAPSAATKATALSISPLCALRAEARLRVATVGHGPSRSPMETGSRSRRRESSSVLFEPPLRTAASELLTIGVRIRSPIFGWLTSLYRHATLPSPLPASVPADSQDSPLVEFAYGYDLEGRKSEETRTGGGLTSETTGYGYDALGRLDEVILPGGTVRSYLFDLDSNRTEIKDNGTTIATYTYNSNLTPGVETRLIAVEGNEEKWATKDVSYDGIEITRIGTEKIEGLGWDDSRRIMVPFTVDLSTGYVEGGASFSDLFTPEHE